ncbi:MAG: carbamoyl-phosphate synthase large subunit [Mucispirillum sp.]|nr:carbamoyl-phosphate synthase large subunit [Mucispirillum sp.]
MPKREDIKKILIIGSGPIVIGQACEFDYSGTQACKALKELGYEVVLVNSNPATIMTDPDTADITYIEPLNIKMLETIIEKERPDSLLPSLGGQTGLNLTMELSKAGILDKYNVEVIGINLEAIERGEDRIIFKETMEKIGVDMPKSIPAYTVEEAEKIANDLGYPVVVRPAYTLGGTGGGLVYNATELRKVASNGIAASMINQVLIEESVAGWEELELEIVRDSKGQIITVCFIENIDPMGVHTGDSFCAAPMLTISEDVQKRLQKHAWDIAHNVGVTGGTNVQFAHDPKTDRIVIIEINPRTSRSSALASKATGFPIAYISAKLAAGLTLDEIPHYKFGTLDKYKPNGDYIVIKFARWAFEKFPQEEDVLGTQMKAVGEVMSIGSTYKEAFLKAIRSLENGRFGLGNLKEYKDKSLDELRKLLYRPSSQRQWIMYEAVKKGMTIDELHNITKIKHYFLEEMQEIVDMENKILSYTIVSLPDNVLYKAKKYGFSDKYIADLLKTKEKTVRERRHDMGIRPVFLPIGVSGVPKDEKTSLSSACYYYSTYNRDVVSSEPVSNDKKKVMVLGSGPNRIGQGIEFDYCSVHAAFAMKEAGYETIIVNCNPETVSTDYDTSDRLYFEPLTVEDVIEIYNYEKPEGAIVQFGGQTPLNIAKKLESAGVKMLGTKPEVIASVEDRELFARLMDKLNIKMPEADTVTDITYVESAAAKIGYPVIIRPSYVLGGRGMAIIHNESELREYLAQDIEVSSSKPLLIDRFLNNALECEADALCDGKEAFVPAIMEHIELAGVHSGDSACVIPPVRLTEKQQETIESYMKIIAVELGVVGLINVQFAVENNVIYVLEANPRASRTVPIVSKVTGIPMAKIATLLMEGRSLASFNLKKPAFDFYAVKQAVLPFNKFPNTDPVLGPEMKSTGEVMGIADTFDYAYYKAEESAGLCMPLKGTVLLSCDKKDDKLLETAKILDKIGFKIVATRGTYTFLQENNIKSEFIFKESEGRPNITDLIINGELNLIIDTPGSKSLKNDGALIRKSAVKYGIPYVTTIDAAIAAANGIKAAQNAVSRLRSLQEINKRG